MNQGRAGMSGLAWHYLISISWLDWATQITKMLSEVAAVLRESRDTVVISTLYEYTTQSCTVRNQ